MKVIVTKVSDQTTNGKFIHTLVGQKKTTSLGVTQTQKVKYLIALDEAVDADSEHELDMSQYNVTLQENEIVDEQSGEVKIVHSNWLFLK